MGKENLRSNSKDREEAKVYNSASSNQLGIFGDGWIYRTILEETKDHPLVKLRPYVDEVLSRMDKDLRVYYSPDEGRPSISPSVLFKMLLLEYLYNLSDVAVSRICVHDFLFRWFIGVDPTDSIPDDSTLVRFRKRLGEEGFQDIFNELIAVAKKHGYLKGKLRAIDATHIFSDTPKLGVVALLKQGVRKVIQRVRRLSEAKASRLEKEYRDIYKRKVRESKEKVERVRKGVLKFVREVEEEIRLDCDELLNMLKEVAKGTLALVSFTDPDARWGRKSKEMVFGGYKIHVICDTETGLATSVEVTPGNVNEGGDLPRLIEGERRRGLEIEGVTADKLYDSASNRKYLKRMKIKAHIPSLVPGSEIDRFELRRGKVRCKAGKYPIGKIRQERGDLFYFSVKDCRRCKLREGCVSPGEIRKKVYLSDCKRLREEIDKEKYKKRTIIEGLFGRGKRWYGLDRARYRGRWKVGIQVFMSFFAMNLKVMVSTTGCSPP